MNIELRRETEKDCFEAENMCRRAFWNKYRPGCDEHLLVHKMRSHPDYLPECSRIAMADGRIVGLIMYFKCRVIGRDGRETEVASFGPLCTDHALKNHGIGARLLEETLPLVRAAGFPGVIIFGEPDYYPKHGFVRAGSLGLTDANGKVYDPFMAYEFEPGSLRIPGGRFIESSVGEELPEAELEALEASRPYDRMTKAIRPCQWTYDNASEEKDGYSLMYAVQAPRDFDALFIPYIEELSRYDEGLKRHDPAKMVAALRENPGAATYLIRRGGESIGLLATSVPEPGKEERGCGAMLEEIWLKPEHRGQGIGKDIFLRFLRQQTTDTGFRVIPGNPAREMWLGLLDEAGYSFTLSEDGERLLFCRVRTETKE